MKLRSFGITAIILLSSSPIRGQPECIPQEGGKCLTESQFQKVREALLELDNIKKSEMKVDFPEPLVIVQDWENRVYMNGGNLKSLKLRVTVGTVDRTLAMELPTVVYYRDKPPDPVFRLRIRAQGGIIIPDVWSGSGRLSFLDAGIGWDFFHINQFNLSVNTGISSAGIVLGVDLTRNFRFFSGHALVYRDFHSGIIVGSYMSFNLHSYC